MSISTRYMDSIMAAFNEEPGDTEWHLVNALTRFASHNAELPRESRVAIQRGAGDWVYAFDVVTARLPRPIAERVGATIQ